MPNLEYSVKFVLASDATTSIEDALRRMRETGSTITVRMTADTSSVTREMRRVEEEVKKVDSSTKKLEGTTTSATSRMSKTYTKLASDIAKAKNQFTAFPDQSGAMTAFDGLAERVAKYGRSLTLAGKDMDSFNKLTIQLKSAQNASERAYSTSQSALERYKKSIGGVAVETRGITREILRLSVTQGASAEQISRLFGRTATSAKDLVVTTADVTHAFHKQKEAVEASNLAYDRKQALLNLLTEGERRAAQSIRYGTLSLAQQENGVGDVSYAMMSFTRLLEDVPYGFRGFANNIQPTVFGLIQLNGVTEQLSARFRGIHGRELPLMGRALINLRMAIRSPINQLLLLTSTIAVVGTYLERWGQQSDKAGEATKSLSDEYLTLFDAVKSGENPLDADYSDSIKGLESYSQALQGVIDELGKAGGSAEELQSRIRRSGARDVMPSFALTKEEEKRLENAKLLGKEASERLKATIKENEIQKMILGTESARRAILEANSRRIVADTEQNIQNINEEIRLNNIRLAQGEKAAVQAQFEATQQKLVADIIAGKITGATYVAKLDEARAIRSRDLQKIEMSSRDNLARYRDEYAKILQDLTRRLEDENNVSQVASLQIQRTREIADLQADIARKRKDGAIISQAEEKALFDLVNKRYDTLEEIASVNSTQVLDGLRKQVAINTMLLALENANLVKDFEKSIALDFQAMEMEHQLALSQAILGVKKKDYATTEDYNEAVKQTTELIKQQFALSLKMRQLSAEQDVERFLRSGTDNDIIRVQEQVNSARLAQESSYQAQLAQLKQQYANDEDMLRRKEQLALLEHQRKLGLITEEGTRQIQAIKTRGYLEGAMMITSALDQLATSTEARSKKEFEQQKAFSASMATINTLLGITQVLSDKTIVPSFLKFAMASSLALTGFAQVRRILSTKYGGAQTGTDIQNPQQGFQEIPVIPTRNAMAGVGATASRQGVMNNITVTGNVDREGIYFLVSEGNDLVSSRATFAG